MVILEEVLTRYPFLFYYAIEEGYYGPAELYTKGTILPEMTNIYEMLEFNKKVDQGNMFVRYLLKK
jgi:hypothetical protein